MGAGRQVIEEPVEYRLDRVMIYEALAFMNKATLDHADGEITHPILYLLMKSASDCERKW